MEKAVRKRPGPLPTGVGKQIQVRMHPPLLRALDNWVLKNAPDISRQEAIRRMICRELANEKAQKT